MSPNNNSGAIEELYTAIMLAENAARHPENQQSMPLDNLSEDEQKLWNDWFRSPGMFEYSATEGQMDTINRIARDQTEWTNAVSSFADSLSNVHPTLRDKLEFIQDRHPQFQPGLMDKINMFLFPKK
tara:strand:+ start:94 stop:474 length:381 start_codon:yes stop_codon:yes gene_type:complete